MSFEKCVICFFMDTCSPKQKTTREVVCTRCLEKLLPEDYNLDENSSMLSEVVIDEPCVICLNTRSRIGFIIDACAECSNKEGYLQDLDASQGERGAAYFVNTAGQKLPFNYFDDDMKRVYELRNSKTIPKPKRNPEVLPNVNLCKRCNIRYTSEDVCADCRDVQLKLDALHEKLRHK
jgi:hypothetical protein